MSRDEFYSACRKLELLLQTLWVGGLWVMLLVVLPGLEKTGLVLPVRQEIVIVLVPRLVEVATAVVMLQLILTVGRTGFSRLLGSFFGQSLLVALGSGIFFMLIWQVLATDAFRLLVFWYIAMMISGLLLLFCRVPDNRPV